MKSRFILTFGKVQKVTDAKTEHRKLLYLQIKRGNRLENKKQFSKKNLISKGVFFVIRGYFSDIDIITYKNKIFENVKLLESEQVKKLTLYNFNCKIKV